MSSGGPFSATVNPTSSAARTELFSISTKKSTELTTESGADRELHDARVIGADPGIAQLLLGFF